MENARLTMMKSIKSFGMKIMQRCVEPAEGKSDIFFWFSKGLGVIYAIAFISLMLQFDGLYGEGGILPFSDILSTLKRSGLSWFDVPHIFVSTHSAYFWGALWMGLGVSVCMVAGIFPVITTSMAWIIYVSFVMVGQVFMSFQWDILLCEIGFLSIWACPCIKHWKKSNTFSPPNLVLWAFYGCCFRLMLASGLVKFLSGDPLWPSLEALSFHYYTQPLPHVLSWYAHQLPSWVDKLSLIIMFIIECGVPFLIFISHRTRKIAAYSIFFLMGMISLTGNYTFFNLLTALLAVTLLYSKEQKSEKQVQAHKQMTRIRSGVAIAILVLSIMTEGLRFFPRVFSPMSTIVTQCRPFLLCNTYGLFASMTRTRDELEILASQDGQTWKPYHFKYKPNSNADIPKWVWPHQPRLDWQCWFVSLQGYSRQSWINNLVEGLFVKKEDIESLFSSIPFKDPPSYIVLTTRAYRFTTMSEKKETGQWWVSEKRQQFSPVFEL
ncbi:hypothetical protein DID78_01765 [Candidatus Marinamargulisbacteria bacterium SCGC AG-343-D04]|nr:hypothetical protein DID78_01765 [Candidatus Marinamargulisbacteria bacterium SCGC AG-343-D04]